MLPSTAYALKPASLQAQAEAKPPGERRPGEKSAEEVSPVEDLMREHDVLNRVPLIYEVQRRLMAGEDLDPSVLAGSAVIVRSLIEDYHEKLEEDFLFPRFEKAGKLTDLVQVLLAQHRPGLGLTDSIQKPATLAGPKNADDRKQLTNNLHLFIRMYRPHEAREDTVVFPAPRSIVSPHRYDALGEEFEDKEHQLFGKEGIENRGGRSETGKGTGYLRFGPVHSGLLRGLRQ